VGGGSAVRATAIGRGGAKRGGEAAAHAIAAAPRPERRSTLAKDIPGPTPTAWLGASMPAWSSAACSPERPVGKPGDRAFGGWPQLRLASGGTVSSSSTGDSGDRRRVQLGQRVLQPWRMLMSSFVELDHMSSSMTLTPLSSALMMGT
jgi:hypothetical protein